MKRLTAILIIITMLTGISCMKKNTAQNPPVNPGQNGTVVSPPSQNPAVPDASVQEPYKEDRPVKTNAPEGLSNKKIGWGLGPIKNHTAPYIPESYRVLLNKYSGYYTGDTLSKVIYLTFDEGYENGYTPVILDILKVNNVKAAFFATRTYINREKDIVSRMVKEGHLVCNHSSTHPSMPDKTGNIESFNKEFTDTEAAFKEVTGEDMPKFFRPPMGEFSEKSLYLTQKLGYKTIFWSFAHRDWLVDQQPTPQQAHDRVLSGAHNGEIMLLHAVSRANTEALDSIIKDLKAEGYRFGTLDELK